MSAGIPTSTVKELGSSSALKSAEWMAENAYIAPGFHRLLTAGGLTLGLYGGRKFMDVLTARDGNTGEEIPAKRTSELMRPLHGIMRYNPYSDKPGDRWRFVIDKLAPITIGAAGAYYGGKYFFNGHLPNKEALFPAGKAARDAVAAEKFSTETTDAMMRLFNADAIRRWAAATFIEGSSTGQHIFGALWPFNNGMIAVSFQDGAQRNIYVPGMQKLNKLLGNNGGTSRGHFAAMRETATWMRSNIMRSIAKDGPELSEWATDEALAIRARDGLQKFPAQSEKFTGKLVESYRDLITKGKEEALAFRDHNPKADDARVSEHVYYFLTGKNNSILRAEHAITSRLEPKVGLHGSAHDHLLHKLTLDDGTRFDLTKTDLAQGPFQELGRRFGSRKKQHGILEGHAGYLNTEFGYGLKPKEWATAQTHTPPWKVAAMYGGAGTAIIGGLGTAAAVGAKLHSRSQLAHKPHITENAAEGADTRPSEKPESGHNIVDWINDKPLSVAHWMSRVVIVPPSMHRFMNAAYLSAALYVGVKAADALTGRKLTKLNSAKFIKVGDSVLHESVLQAKDVWLPFKPLYKKMEYTPGSADLKDRWRQAAHYILPVSLGMFGTFTGSHMYFKDRIQSLKNPEALEDYTDRISLEQSKFYAGATALTSIFNTGSGIHLLPVFNYSANLHNRYLMGSGQQVAMPGIGKWWSGNPGTTPWGVKHTLVQMTNYLTYNDTARPMELRSLAHSLIGKLYPKLSDADLLDSKQVMIDRIYDVRDSYLVGGVVPVAKRAALGEAMHHLLSGSGFEALLQESGLDPAKANLASNGASGAIANFLGSKKTVARLADEYKNKFAQHAAVNDNAKPSDYLKTLLDKGPRSADVAQSKNYSERGNESRAYPVMNF